MVVWKPNMVIERAYDIAGNSQETNKHKRRFKTWVTDAIYMKNCTKIAIGSTGRDIRFYDASTTAYFEEYNLCCKRLYKSHFSLLIS